MGSSGIEQSQQDLTDHLISHHARCTMIKSLLHMMVHVLFQLPTTDGSHLSSSQFEVEVTGRA